MLAERYHFKHPTMIEGTIHFEDEQYPVVGGIVECPTSIATDVDGKVWFRAQEHEIEAYQEQLPKPAPDENPLEKILDGTVAGVLEALDAPFEGALLTGGQLLELGTLEGARAKPRKGVLDAIGAKVNAMAGITTGSAPAADGKVD